MSLAIKRQHAIYTALLYRFVLLLVLYSLCRLGFYLANQSFFNHLSFADLAYIFAGGVKFDLVALLYINSLYIILQAIPFPFRYRNGYQIFCKWIFIITNSLGFLANFIDFVYYKYTLKHTTASVFSQFSNEQNKLKLLLDFLSDYWYLVILFGVFTYVFIWLYQLISIKKAPKFTWKIYLMHTIILVLIAGLAVIGMRGGWRHSTRPITMSNAGDFVKQPSDMSLVLNTPFTIMKTLKRADLKPVKYYDTQTLQTIYNPIHEPLHKAPFKKLNVVFSNY